MGEIEKIAVDLYSKKPILIEWVMYVIFVFIVCDIARMFGKFFGFLFK